MKISNKKVISFIITSCIALICLISSLFAWFSSSSNVNTNQVIGIVSNNDTADATLYHYNKTTKEFDELVSNLNLDMVPSQMEYYRVDISNFNRDYQSFSFKITSVSSRFKDGALIQSKYKDDDENPLYKIEDVINYYILELDENGEVIKAQTDLLSEGYNSSISDIKIQIYFAIEFDDSESSYKTFDGVNDYSNCYQNQIFTINKLSINFE